LTRLPDGPLEQRVHDLELIVSALWPTCRYCGSPMATGGTWGMECASEECRDKRAAHCESVGLIGHGIFRPSDIGLALARAMARIRDQLNRR